MPRDSRFLTLILRHRPDLIGIELDKAGWADIGQLLRALKRHGRSLSRTQLEEIVFADNKTRFTVSPDGTRIRAAQGHSLPLDLGLSPMLPPVTLYHGTARHSLDAIFAEGLLPGRRQFVHLSKDVVTAVTVGARHGKAVVLTVNCAAMAAEGHAFVRADNGVWLTSAVPARFLGFAPT
ncbi:RNA 2'-phosphotransferase [Loktanella sp. DJP18]|uniref:RNA 2'-phosphotransferase n=1 Tax=Loktanella sp. DJP18 TaxID=3409788 RepID=UPI003BB68AEF